MCGFAGEITLGRGTAASLERTRPMLGAIMHRGPDARGEWADAANRVAFQHCRLSIVDVAHGHQPMLDPGGRVAVVFNGEIYGFEAHREALAARGYRFATRCDTEVLIALYLAHGHTFVERLEGEFAFVLHDTAKRRTLLARDRFGVKPLFFSQQRGLLLFGSEIKAVLAHPFAERALDRAALHRRLHGVMIPDETVFRGVEAVPPGALFEIDAEGRISKRRHADLDPQAAGTRPMGEAAAIAAFEEAFAAAVSERLQGEVPIGLYLSGGVDSSATAAMMREVSGAPHDAFTVGFEAPPYAEAEAAARTAAHLDFGHHVVPAGAGSLDGTFERSLWHGETPIANGHGTAKVRLAETAARHVKVVLAGEGADEIHGGYTYFRHAALLQAADADAAGERALLKAFTDAHGPNDGVLPKAPVALRRRLAGSAGHGVPYAAIRAARLTMFLRLVLTREFQRAGDGDPTGQMFDWLDARAPGARRLDDVTLSRFVSAIMDLSTYNLSYLCDRAEMASSLEGRMPFLDKRVVDLLWGLQPAHHLGAAHGKPILRAALARRLPERSEVPKRMFLAPAATLEGVLAGHLADRWLAPEVVRAAGIYRPRALTLLRRMSRRLAPASRVRHLIDGLLMMAVSVHMLEHHFCRHFDAALAQFGAPDPAPPSPRYADTMLTSAN